jgi:hypothetical protein
VKLRTVHSVERKPPGNRIVPFQKVRDRWAARRSGVTAVFT